jgi:hypothetical protein
VPRFTEAEMVEVWDRWQARDGYRLIGLIWDGQRRRSERLSNRGVGSVPNRGDGHCDICR